jgi:hypothetical protein
MGTQLLHCQEISFSSLHSKNIEEGPEIRSCQKAAIKPPFGNWEDGIIKRLCGERSAFPNSRVP